MSPHRKQGGHVEIMSALAIMLHDLKKLIVCDARNKVWSKLVLPRMRDLNRNWIAETKASLARRVARAETGIIALAHEQGAVHGTSTSPGLKFRPKVDTRIS